MIERFTFGKVGERSLTSFTLTGDGKTIDYDTGLNGIQSWWLANLSGGTTLGVEVTGGVIRLPEPLDPGSKLTVCVQHT